MPDWRRAYVPGGSFFFTVVTDRRARILTTKRARTLLGQLIRECRDRWPFRIDAIVLLPDHLHTIWTLPTADTEYSKRWAWIKKEFTKEWIAKGGVEQSQTRGRIDDGRRGVWQPKFWEHTLRDEEDFERHFNYIHYNPVKHGLVKCPREWRWSSFHRWVREGVYPFNWACDEESIELDFAMIASTVGE
ncbi:MAG TPA: transposase [Planctomycetaceae bacterium]|nr:transposase [Planctomycetaceae bacterium]